ncbi:MAG TPA: hypothetical protein VFB96_20855 [Pirellulaceae bacterium]|nr:hypothetical protein [Pirellulaceae bacterium]
MRNLGKSRGLAGTLAATIFWVLVANAAAQEKAAEPSPDEGRQILKHAAEHMQELQMHLADDADTAVELFDRPVLTYGDSARANKNGTLWAFGKSGRPLAVMELYQGLEPNAPWVHAVTLTGQQRIKMKTPAKAPWTPAKTQIEPKPFPGVAGPEGKEPQRLRQMKDLARRFTAHEFWNPDNSRFELRLLVQPVLRYRDPDKNIQDGTVFVLAHGTNPEVILLIEAIGAKLEESRWHYSLARLGSAELHVSLDDTEVWEQGRTPGVVGQPSDPYWLFFSTARPLE